jgi:hypothetical protein
MTAKAPWFDTAILQRIANGGTPECFTLTRTAAEQLCNRAVLAEAVVEIIRRTVIDPDARLVDAMRAYDTYKMERLNADHPRH